MRGGYREDGQTELNMNHKRKENQLDFWFIFFSCYNYGLRGRNDGSMLDEIVASVGFQFEFKNGVWT